MQSVENNCPRCGETLVHPTPMICPYCKLDLKSFINSERAKEKTKNDAAVALRKQNKSVSKTMQSIKSDMSSQKHSGYPVCPECGVAISSNEKECPSCGHPCNFIWDKKNSNSKIDCDGTTHEDSRFITIRKRTVWIVCLLLLLFASPIHLVVFEGRAVSLCWKRNLIPIQIYRSDEPLLSVAIKFINTYRVNIISTNGSKTEFLQEIKVGE